MYTMVVQRCSTALQPLCLKGYSLERDIYGMKTVKEYANSVGKSHQAVYKQLQSKKNKERLKDHMWHQDGTTYLDDVAIEILNESRKMTQVKQDRQLKSENERMTKEIDQLKNKIISLQDEVKVKTEQMTSLLLENQEKKMLLEQKDKQINQIEELKCEIDRLKKENDHLLEKVTTQSKSEGQKKGFFVRLFGR